MADRSLFEADKYLLLSSFQSAVTVWRGLVKSIVFQILQTAGVIHLIRRANRNTVAILMLHGVMDEGIPHSWVPLRPQISRTQLRRGLKILSRYYRFIGLEQAIEMLSGRAQVEPHCMVITFDDGYRNCLNHALPILREFGAPVTVFLANGNIDRRDPFWFDRLDYAIQHVDLKGRSFYVGNEKVCFASADREDLRAGFKKLRDSAKLSVRDDVQMIAEMSLLADALEKESGCNLGHIFENDDWSGLLSWPEIAEAAKLSDVTFGSHTVDHTRLGCVEMWEACRQLSQSKESIERHTGKVCSFFCFPNGSFSRQSMEWVRQCGYRSAVTTQEGLNRIHQNPFALFRLSLPWGGSQADLLWETHQVKRLSRISVSGHGVPFSESIIGS
jgi:peptidoglycan/xylan/chitin deacetylase (PgdA/CDA1 family)